jgi:hypothetical protein
LSPANVPRREIVAAMLERVELECHGVIGDKGLSVGESNSSSQLGGVFMRPTAATKPRFGSLARNRRFAQVDLLRCQRAMGMEPSFQNPSAHAYPKSSGLPGSRTGRPRSADQCGVVRAHANDVRAELV